LARWAHGAAADKTALPLLDTALPDFERVLIRAALQQTGGRKRQAAELLGWGRNTLTRKIAELDLHDL
jgi:two-component system nitrogen regulation response regulator GlnG